MSIPRNLAAVTASLLLLVSSHAFGWASEWGPNQVVSTDAWPPRLTELVNSKSRVAGYFINQDDYFAFRGNTNKFKAFLDTCAGLGDFAPATLHIHKGNGLFISFDKAKAAVPCNWQLDIINQHWRSTEPHPKGPMYSLDLHVWEDGFIDLASIKIPATMKRVEN